MAPNVPRKTPSPPDGETVVPTRSQLGIETRAAPRGPASAVPSITGVRLSPSGGDCVLVNISSSGLLADCGERVQTGSTVTVNFEGTFSPRSVQGKVTRTSVSSMSKGRLRYHVGIAFNTPIPIEELSDTQKAEAETSSREPAPPAAKTAPQATPPTAPAVFNRW